MTSVMAPFAGAILSLPQFTDMVFRDELLGSGLGIRPHEEVAQLRVHAPISGTVIKTLPHAFIILGGSTGVMVHVGIDTVNLNGQGFQAHIEEGQEVTAGQLCYVVDTKVVRDAGYSLDTPVILMESAKGTITTERDGEPIAQGAELFALP